MNPIALLVSLTCSLLPVLAFAQSVEEKEAKLSENPLKDAYFGETHFHTSYSLDAYIGGARAACGSPPRA